MRQEVEDCVAEGVWPRVCCRGCVAEGVPLRVATVSGEILLTTKQLFAARPKFVV